MTHYRYGKWAIRHDPPPVPWRHDDWRFVHDDYDGDGDWRCGTAANPVACVEEIRELEEEHAET